MFYKLKKIIFKIFKYNKKEIRIHKMKEKTFIINFFRFKVDNIIFFL